MNLRFLLVPALLLASGCMGVRPADEALVAALERCTDPEDQVRLEGVAQHLTEGRWEPALASIRGLLPRYPSCARLPILARRALSQAPEKQQETLREDFRARFAAALRGTTDKTATATLSFGVAIFARDGDEQRKWLANAIQSDPEHYYALCKQGEDLWIRGELEDAKEVLRRAVGLRKSLAEGWLLLAHVAEDRGLYRTAAKHYRSYLGLRPLDRTVQLNYVRLLVHQLRESDRAEEILDRLVAADPTNVEVGLNRGLVYWQQQRWGKAEATYREVLRRYPREPRVVLSLGNLYHGAMGVPVKALQVYRYLLTLDMSSEPQTILHQLLFVPSRIKRIEKELAEKGIQIPPPPQSMEDILGA